MSEPVKNADFRNKDVHGKKYSRILLVISIIAGTFVAVLNQTILSTALPHLMEFFNVEASTAQWVTTAYMLTNGIMIPLTALMFHKIPTRRIFLFSLISFSIGTIICAFSQSFVILLAGRVVQAIGAGIMMPLVNTVFLIIFPKEKRGLAMGLFGLVVSFAPAIGPTLAGLVLDNMDWHWLFILLLPLIAFSLIFALFFMRDVIPTKNPKIDVLSVVLSTIGFGSLLYGISNAGSKGWSDVVVISTIVTGAVITALFVWRQFAMKEPLLELRVFKSGTFALSVALVCIMSIAQTGGSIIIPIFIQSILGKTAFQSGLVLLPGALVMAIVMMISGGLFDKLGAKKLVIPGMILLIAASLPYTQLSQTTSLTYVSIVYAFRFVGIALVLMPLQTSGMNSLHNKLMAHGTSVFNTARQITASIGTAVLITIMTNVSTSSMPDKALAATNLAGYKSKALDAAIHGMNVTFWVATGVVIVALIVSFFLNDTKNEILELDKVETPNMA
jgi:EmrB/QacA subfamily drug resistance transporter